ncbi:cytochrome P450 [Byssothecium circinans]|uniref:Cytochrome P450 n=1 Tax=Byssothecium circinans TaxID=147558 RepID=A0A6A5TFQ3_9PLEO|nr:cytochrome P450 [Byssothecium circinans]
MDYTPISAITGLALFALYLFLRQRSRDAIARRHGGGIVTKHRPWEPLSGFDFHMAMHMDVPSLYRHHQQYGHTFKVNSLLSQPPIITIAPENIRVVNSGKDWGIEPLRLAGMEYFCGRGFLTTDGDVWQHSRKLLKPTFAKANLIDLTFLSREFDRFVDQLPKDRATVDLQPLFYTMFLNTSLHFLLGVDLREESAGAPCTSDQFINAFHDALFLTMFRVLLGRAWKLAPQSKYLNACQTAHEYLDYYVDKALHEADQSTDPKASSMLRILSTQTDDREYIRSQVLQGMMASQETTSALLGNACFLLSRHPTYWAEIRAGTLNMEVESLDFDTLLNFTLVKNILLETLRLYPNFPLLARTALNNTHLPSGAGPAQDRPIYVPKGTLVVMSYYALHRDTHVFGEDVEAFRPERWNDVRPGQWEYMAFGGGNRACMGQQKVLVEAAFVLIRMAKAFAELESRDSKEWKGELKLTCKSANGCKVAVVA